MTPQFARMSNQTWMWISANRTDGSNKRRPRSKFGLALIRRHAEWRLIPDHQRKILSRLKELTTNPWSNKKKCSHAKQHSKMRIRCDPNSNNSSCSCLQSMVQEVPKNNHFHSILIFRSLQFWARFSGLEGIWIAFEEIWAFNPPNLDTDSFKKGDVFGTHN
jgi:hypothetical protein